ncbi:YbaB/EbfC family nucleoid-associated protein [Streptosporangium sp. NPDC000396]|uniref:YbaB/EbfC family nucleoid-associated protein n=1 Tax=Streptosporangium sp. NPDC000396 TaxID=3366185 RepID=UPI0036A4D935
MHQIGQGFGELIAETRRLLSEAGNSQDSAEEPLQGSGQAAGGQVSAVAGPDGRLRELTLNPRVMRMASKDLAWEILTAVNAALDDLRAGLPGLEQAAALDPGPLVKSLDDVHDEMMRRLGEFTAGIEFTVRRLEER